MPECSPFCSGAEPRCTGPPAMWAYRGPGGVPLPGVQGINNGAGGALGNCRVPTVHNPMRGSRAGWVWGVPPWPGPGEACVPRAGPARLHPDLQAPHGLDLSRATPAQPLCARPVGARLGLGRVALASTSRVALASAGWAFISLWDGVTRVAASTGQGRVHLSHAWRRARARSPPAEMWVAAQGLCPGGRPSPPRSGTPPSLRTGKWLPGHSPCGCRSGLPESPSAPRRTGLALGPRPLTGGPWARPSPLPSLGMRSAHAVTKSVPQNTVWCLFNIV